jgi:hypothetical protein
MIGMSNTTIGVLFMNALKTAPATSVVTRASTGRVDQARPTIVASGCSAPVVSSALPTIMSAQIAISEVDRTNGDLAILHIREQLKTRCQNDQDRER